MVDWHLWEMITFPACSFQVGINDWGHLWTSNMSSPWDRGAVVHPRMGSLMALLGGRTEPGWLWLPRKWLKALSWGEGRRWLCVICLQATAQGWRNSRKRWVRAREQLSAGQMVRPRLFDLVLSSSSIALYHAWKCVLSVFPLRFQLCAFSS